MSKRSVYYEIDHGVSPNKVVLNILIVDGEQETTVTYDFESEELLQGFLKPFIMTQEEAGDEVIEGIKEATS